MVCASCGIAGNAFNYACQLLDVSMSINQTRKSPEAANIILTELASCLWPSGSLSFIPACNSSQTARNSRLVLQLRLSANHNDMLQLTWDHSQCQLRLAGSPAQQLLDSTCNPAATATCISMYYSFTLSSLNSHLAFCLRHSARTISVMRQFPELRLVMNYAASHLEHSTICIHLGRNHQPNPQRTWDMKQFAASNFQFAWEVQQFS